MRRWLVRIACVSALCGVLFTATAYRDALAFHWRRLRDPKIAYEEEMLLHILRHDPAQLFHEYDSYLRDRPDRLRDCHGILHAIGHEALEESGWDASMKIAHPLCGGGYIHGVIEAKFGLLAAMSPSTIRSEIIGACGDPTNEVCYHGIGHGLMVLFHDDVSRSLETCDTTALPGRIDCYDGVFMHVFDAEETGIAKNIPERNLGSKLCDSVGSQRQSSCRFYAPRVFARTPSMIEDAANSCKKTTDADAARVCALGSGHMFMKYLLPDIDSAIEACDEFASSMLQGECEVGVKMYRDLQANTGFTDASPSSQ